MIICSSVKKNKRAREYMNGLYDDFIEILKQYISDVNKAFGVPVDEITLKIINERFENKLPKDFLELYKMANGEKSFIASILGFALMPIETINREYTYLLQGTNMIESYEKGKISEGKYNPMWLPIASDGSGSFLLLDLAPGDTGIVGQIITWDIDSNKSYVIAQSFQELLLTIIPQALRDGELEVDDEEEPTMFVWADGHYFNNIEKRIRKG